MARKTKNITVVAPETMEEADQYLRDIGFARIELRDIDTDLREKTAKIKQEAEDQAAPIRLEIESKWMGLQAWAQANRKRLTNGGQRKTIKLPSGSVSWRILPAKVSLRGVGDILERLKSTPSFQSFLRTKHEIDKDAMLRDKSLASTIPGVSIASEGETIDYTVDETKLSQS